MPIIKALQKLYEDKFHLELGNFEGGIVPSSINLTAGTADVKYNIYVARIAVVEVTGNTRTKDQVIRRELRERVGMVLNTDAIKRDYQRLNALNFFSKVEPDVRPGPDPKKPQDVTLVWHVTEQRTASASVGFGYSGGITGLGLYATLGLTDNNLHGTGDSAGIQFEEGARTESRRLLDRFRISAIRRRGNATRPAARSLQTFDVLLSGVQHPRQWKLGRKQLCDTHSVTLYPSSTSQQLSNIYATSTSSSNGVTGNVGRRLSDYTILSLSVTGEKIKIRHDRAVAVLFPRQSTEHLHRTDAEPDQLAAKLRRVLRHRSFVDRQRQHRRSL